VLPIFHSKASPPTIYVSAEDGSLRQSFSADSPPLPTFHDATKRSNISKKINVFLVILNAEIKFHRYLHMISQTPPRTPLPANVINLMHLTMELVDVLYWKPVPIQGSHGEPIFAEKMKYSQSVDKKRKFHFPADMDLKARKEYGTALMSGHGMLFYLHKFNLLNMFI
jgi:hypothetical protein